ncbi:MAG: hypothetical protein ACHQIG_02240 [Acidimicrobiia bacterium]
MSSESARREPHPESVPYEDVGRESHAASPPSTLELVVTELLGAVPEVRDSLLAAADSLLDAARALIDAADRVVDQHRTDAPNDW